MKALQRSRCRQEKSYDSLSQQNKTSGRYHERCSPSQPDVIFAFMNAIVNVLVDEVLLPHCHKNGAMNPTIAIQNAHAFDVRCSNWLVIANKNAHAFGLSSSLASQMMKIRKKYSRRSNVSILENSSPRL